MIDELLESCPEFRRFCSVCGGPVSDGCGCEEIKADRIPSRDSNPDGLHVRYRVFRADMSDIAPGEYFVLRLDNGCKDKAHISACRKAIMVYADEIEATLPKLAADIRQRYASPRLQCAEVKNDRGREPCPYCAAAGEEISEGECLSERDGKYFKQTGCTRCGALGPEAPCADIYDNELANRLWDKRAEADVRAAFNSAIDFAIEDSEPAAFLKCWREGDWEAIRKEWPEFDLQGVTPNEV